MALITYFLVSLEKQPFIRLDEDEWTVWRKGMSEGGI